MLITHRLPMAPSLPPPLPPLPPSPQAGLARSAALGPTHTATLACRRAAVPHLTAAGFVPEAQLLAGATLRQATGAYGEVREGQGRAGEGRGDQGYVAVQERIPSCLL